MYSTTRGNILYRSLGLHSQCGYTYARRQLMLHFAGDQKLQAFAPCGFGEGLSRFYVSLCRLGFYLEY